MRTMTEGMRDGAMRDDTVHGGAADDRRLLSETRLREIFTRARGYLADPETRLHLKFTAGWYGELRWARNRVNLASDRRDLDVYVMVTTKVGIGQANTNQLDERLLERVVRRAEHQANISGGGWGADAPEGLNYRAPLLPYPDPTIWSDATYGITPDQRGVIARMLTEGAEVQGLLSSGFLQMRVGEQLEFGTDEPIVRDAVLPEFGSTIVGAGAARQARVNGYTRHTEAQCSMTVRESKGNGSGWAGVSCYDWAVIDAKALADRALDFCTRSLNPVRIEPGRYTVVLEAQAVADLVAGTPSGSSSTLGNHWLGNRFYQEERRWGPFFLGVDQALGVGRTKLGLKVVDERITIRHDPMHPLLGMIPALGLTPVTWIDRGVLRALGYKGLEMGEREQALTKLQQNVPILDRYAMEMTGGTATVAEMIASTKRGLWVTRFSNVGGLDDNSLLHKGTTRDGLWLIENGKVTKAVKNMWFTDSPLFVLNQLVDLGMPVPVFRPGDNDLRPALVPPLKANDFAFTATIDAV